VTHATVVICAILLLLAAIDIDPGRQSATSHTPKINAEIEKIACATTAIKCKGELE